MEGGGTRRKGVSVQRAYRLRVRQCPKGKPRCGGLCRGHRTWGTHSSGGCGRADGSLMVHKDSLQHTHPYDIHSPGGVNESTQLTSASTATSQGQEQKRQPTPSLPRTTPVTCVCNQALPLQPQHQPWRQSVPSPAQTPWPSAPQEPVEWSPPNTQAPSQQKQQALTH
jgi:hypothetical protein